VSTLLEYHPIHPSSLSVFKDVFLAYGARGYRDNSSFVKVHRLNESEKLQVVPLVFQLLPFSVVNPHSGRRLVDPIKPAIKHHISTIGLDESDHDLIEILKSCSDQYFKCAYAKEFGTKPNKNKISDLRANKTLYKKICDRQNNRCCICGSVLRIQCDETLDHIIPFSLMGDIPDGANWQILCSECNSGKGHYLSALQIPHSINWIYPRVDFPVPSRETRYCALTRNPQCAHPGCNATAMTRQLRLVHNGHDGLAIYSNLRVYCELH
jgi:5-methylcytosine-specific restriction endonuclease McrA